MIDIVQHIESVHREVGAGHLPAGEGRAVRLRRDYDTPIEEVWDALTDPARIGRWFLPISGDFRLGGRYQFEGNAGGKIVACERPNRLKATWEYGDISDPGAVSEVEVRLSKLDEGTTRFELEHVAIVPEEMWDQFGPGAVGVGWDGGVLGLTLHLRGGQLEDPIAWQLSDEGRDFSTRASVKWGAANEAAGTNPEAVARGVANTTAFYAPEPDAEA